MCAYKCAFLSVSNTYTHTRTQCYIKHEHDPTQKSRAKIKYLQAIMDAYKHIELLYILNEI